MNENPFLIRGGIHRDERGVLSFVNDFDMTAVRRFYLIEHQKTGPVRAWQGHKEEQKWFFVVRGIFELALIRPDNWEQPSPDLKPLIFRLSEDNLSILHVPGGYVNGFKALEEGSKLMVYSNLSIEAAAHDDYRFDKNLWYDWN